MSIDSSTLKRSYYPDWEVAFLRHTKAMYLSIPWPLLKPWSSVGAARSAEGRANMRSFMDGYAKREVSFLSDILLLYDRSYCYIHGGQIVVGIPRQSISI